MTKIRTVAEALREDAELLVNRAIRLEEQAARMRADADELLAEAERFPRTDIIISEKFCISKVEEATGRKVIRQKVAGIVASRINLWPRALAAYYLDGPTHHETS